MFDKNIFVLDIKKRSFLFVLSKKNVFLWHKYVFLSPKWVLWIFE